MAHIESTFLNIPTELRLQILQSLLPEDGNIRVDFCAVKSATRQDFGNRPRRSPIASFLSDHSAVSEFAQQYGLHLAAVCRQLRAEYVPLVANLTRLAPHCPSCLDKIFSHLVKDLDISLPVLYHINFTAKFSPSYRFPRSQIGPTDGLQILSSVFIDLRRVVGKYYGRYDLLDDNEAHIGKRQRWMIKRVTTQRKIIEFDETHAPQYEDKEIVKEKCFASTRELNDDDFRPNSDWDLAFIHKNSAYLQEWFVLGELGL